MRHSNVQSPPRTIMEAYKSLPEGTLAELIDGIIYMSPAPSPFHQRISREIVTQLNDFVTKGTLGEVFYAPVDVYLDDEQNAVQPDIIFLASNGATVITKQGVHGVPALIIEIISPGNPRHDTITKKALYERFGVAEYCIVDPETKEAKIFSLKEGRYEKVDSRYGQIYSPMLDRTFVF